MKLSERGLSLIKESEGLRLDKYQDTSGLWTIGYGHLIKEGEIYEIISAAKAAEILEEDVEWAENEVNALPCKLSQGQFDALVDLVFNVGVKTFRESTIYARLLAHNINQAGHELRRWVHDEGQVRTGLLIRRARAILVFYNAQAILA
ncbi:MAG: lysozyme [Pyrinomonadaceae bacterium]